MKRFAVCMLVSAAVIFAATQSAHAQYLATGLGVYRPGYSSFGPSYGMGSGISLSVGPSSRYTGVGIGNYGYQPHYVAYGGNGSLSQNFFSYGHMSPAYTVRHTARHGFSSRYVGRCR